MARKDVELVVRAKDEAAKALNAVTAAINSLTDSQDDLVKGAGKSETALTRLGSSFDQLEKSLRGATLGQQIARSLDNATKAVDRLDKAVNGTVAELDDLSRQSAEAAASTERLKAEAQQAAVAVERETAALNKAKGALADQTKGLRDATAERDKLARADARLTKQIGEQEARVAKATARQAELAAEMAATTEPTKTLQERLAKANTAVDAQTQKLADLQGQLAATRTATGNASASIEKWTTDVAQATQAVEQQKISLAATEQQQVEANAAARAAAQQQKALEGATEGSREALDAQRAALDRAQTEMGQLQAAAAEADGALSRLASGSTAQLQTAFNANRRAMLETRREWVQSEAAVKELAAAMTRVGPPTREQAVAWNAATTAARAAKAEYKAQQVGLQQLSAILKETGGDVDELRARQQRFAQVQAEVGARLAAVREDAGQTVAAFEKLAVASDRTSNAMRRVAREGAAPPVAPVNSLADAYRRLYGETRLAMSWTQRLRGEVLSLVSAYGGIYGVINLLTQSVTAFQTLEAATSRLNAVFGGDQSRVSAELDFLRRTADRLGVSFGDLSNEYSRFAVATQGTILEGQKTRDIFVSVTEAARVNKVSTEDLKGVFTALTQIVSKGSVQMEELRQQLGDRLPGAIQIMAAGLGVGTDELIKMMEQGQVTSSALVNFAQELDRRFGSQLTAALQTTSAELGKFQNAAFQALIAFGQAGFIEAFTNLLKTMTETLRSADFQAFAARVSQAFALIINVIGVLIDNFELLNIALGVFLAAKIAPFVVAILANFGLLSASARGLGATLTRLGVIFVATMNTMRASSGAMAAAAVAARGLSAAFATLLSSTGIGLAITAIAIGIGYWISQADSATEALNLHQKMVDQVRNAYDEAGGAVEDWKAALDDLTVTQARANLQQLEQALRDAESAFGGGIGGLGGVLRRNIFGDLGLGETREVQAYLNAVGEVWKSYERGETSADSLRERVDALTEEYRDSSPRVAELGEEIVAAAQKIRDQADAVGESRDIIIALTGSNEEATAALARLNNEVTTSGNAAATAADNLRTYQNAIETLKGAIPELADELKRLKDLAAIDAAYEAAIKVATSIGQVNEAYNLRQRAIAALDASQFEAATNALSNFTDGVQAAAQILRDREGFIATPQADNDGRLRVGFGSDTVTLADGSVRAVTAGIAVSIEDANRDLYRRIGLVQDALRDAVGADRFNALTPAQQAVLTSIAYNYGTGELRAGGDLGSLIEAVRTGTTEGVVAAIQARAGDNGGINAGRRNEEAAIFGSGVGVQAGSQAFIQEQERLTKLAEQRAEEARKFHEAQALAIQQAQLEISLAQQDVITRQVGLALAEAENRAREAGTELSQAEREAIIATTTERYRQQAIEENIAAAREQATTAEQRVNDLISQRQALEQQIAIHRANGNTTALTEAETAVAGINQELVAAIDSAIALWQAIGGDAATAAIEKLRVARLEAQGLNAEAKVGIIDWKRVADIFASTVANAFDKFAEAVANGTNIGEAARDAFLQFASDFLRQIAQMIIQQIALNAARAILGGFGIPVGHTGGLVGSRRIGSGNGTRNVDPGIFAGAQRFHSGGPVGLRPGEVPAILQKNEEVLTQDDPRNILNGGVGAAVAGGAVQQGDTKIVNMFDAASFLTEALNTKVGERAVLNWVRANPAAFRAALGG